ncbi:MAG: twin-arginine translocation signal domain-containing protein [Candidatus Poseidoniia archaeon]|jgi:Rieske Fe-S protein|nr:twin-arginine translocation signal domain-containing protein [Candidatus Poseidoniia archaeon]|tara:strand:+ start:227 stop:901 length:675 start_codon:yes stop_codon:yes gene_type:complete
MNITRRGFLQGAIGLAGAGMTGALTVPALKTLLPPPITRCNSDDAHETLTYKKEEGKWYENKGGKIAIKEDFKLWDVAIVNWAPKELEEELGSCEIQLALVKVPAESGMEELGISVDEGNAMMMAYHTYKCPHLCCKPVFTPQGKSTISGNDYENMFLCPCHLSMFDPLDVITNIDEKGREVKAARLLEGPAPYGLPVVPIAEKDGGLIGLTNHLDWLKYCGQG